MMARWLIVTGLSISNIIETGNGAPPAVSNNDVAVLAATGLESVGDAFNVATAKQTNQYNALDPIIVAELFRLTNETRILKLQGALTMLQYIVTLKALMP